MLSRVSQESSSGEESDDQPSDSEPLANIRDDRSRSNSPERRRYPRSPMRDSPDMSPYARIEPVIKEPTWELPPELHEYLKDKFNDYKPDVILRNTLEQLQWGWL